MYTVFCLENLKGRDHLVGLVYSFSFIPYGVTLERAILDKILLVVGNSDILL